MSSIYKIKKASRINNSTSTTTKTTGAFIVDGGISSGENIILGGYLGITGTNNNIISLTANASTGAYNFNLPIASGSSGDVLTSQGGGSTAMTWSTSTGTSNIVRSNGPTFGASTVTFGGPVTGITTIDVGSSSVNLGGAIGTSNVGINALSAVGDKYNYFGYNSNTGNYGFIRYAYNGDNNSLNSIILSSNASTISLLSGGGWNLMAQTPSITCQLQGNIIQDGNITLANNVSSILTIQTTTGNTLVVNSTSSSTSSVTSNSISTLGGIGVTGSSFFSNTTASTSNSTGAIVIGGGIGITNTTDASSVTNGGTITSAGGVAIAKRLFVGNSLNLAGSTYSSALSITAGSSLTVPATTYTDTTGASTVALRSSVYIGTPTFTSTNAVVATDATSLYIQGAPIATASATITNPYALYINGGSSLFNTSSGTNLSLVNNSSSSQIPYTIFQPNLGLNNDIRMQIGITNSTTNGAIVYNRAQSVSITFIPKIFSIISITGGATKTFTTGGNHTILNGESITISNSNISGFNGTYVVSNVTSNTFDLTNGTSSVGYIASSASTALTSVIISTVSSHNLITGNSITISGAGTTPSVDGNTYTITFISSTTFSIPVTITFPGGSQSYTSNILNNIRMVHDGMTTGISMNGNNLVTLGTSSRGILSLPQTSGNTLVLSSTASSTSTIASNSISTLGGIGVTGQSFFSNNTASSSTSTGAIVIAGGIGVGGNSVFGGTLNVSGTASSTSTIASNSISTLGGIGVTGQSFFSNNTASSSTLTGAIVIAGGIGVGGNSRFGGTLNVSGTATSTTTVASNSISTLGGIGVTQPSLFSSNTASSGITSGAIVVVGGIGVGGNSVFGGTFGVSGVATFSSNDNGTLFGIAGSLTSTSIRIRGSASQSLDICVAGGSGNYSSSAAGADGVIRTNTVASLILCSNSTNGLKVDSSSNITINPTGTSGSVYIGSTSFGMSRSSNDVTVFSSGNTIISSGGRNMITCNSITRMSTAADNFILTGSGSGDQMTIMANGLNTGNGYFYYNSGNTFGTISDKRIKKNINNISLYESESFIKNLNPVSFELKNCNDDSIQCGFIAQEVLSACVNNAQKSCINKWETYNENDLDCPLIGVSDRPIVANLVGALKSAFLKLEALEQRLSFLEN